MTAASISNGLMSSLSLPSAARTSASMLWMRAARIWFSKPIQSYGTCSEQRHSPSTPQSPAISTTRGSGR